MIFQIQPKYSKMESNKTFQEKFDEIQEKLQREIRGIMDNIAKTDGGLERLQMMHENHEKLTKYDLSNANCSPNNSD